MGLRYKKANVTHPELGVTVQLPILGVKKNPQNPLYTVSSVLKHRQEAPPTDIFPSNSVCSPEEQSVSPSIPFLPFASWQQS